MLSLLLIAAQATSGAPTAEVAIDETIAAMTLEEKVVAPNGERPIVPGVYRLFVGGGRPGVWSGVTITGERQVLPR